MQPKGSQFAPKVGSSTVGHPAYTHHQRVEGYTDYPDAPAEPVSISFFDDNVDFMLGNDPMGNRVDRIQPEATRQRIDDIKDSVRLTGFQEPIRLDYDPSYGTVDVAEGNHRLMAARELGVSDVPVYVHIMPSAELPPTWGVGRTPRSPKVPPMTDDQVQRHLAHPRNANRVSDPDTVFHRASVSPSEIGIE